MKKKIVVLGAGRVGKEIAKDLSTDYEVTAVDCRMEALAGALAGFPVQPVEADLAKPETIKEIVAPFDLVVGALPGSIGMMALRAVLEAGKDIVDIAFSPEDPFELDDLARTNNLTAIVDFGVAPGMSNLICGYYARQMQRLERFECLVGGLPVVREWPFEYKAVFSPSDVIEEYTRPARYIENGREVVRPALSDPELVNFPDVGTLEAFNTDGLRTLRRTIRYADMREKTLRYPGHARFMEALREAGFFRKEPIEIGGCRISPLEFTSQILFPQWTLEPGEEEFTVMRVTVEGLNAEGNKVTVVYHLLDRFDRQNNVTSMARTTGYACTAAVRLLAEGRFRRKGICPPEYVGEDEGCFHFVFDHLRERGVYYRKEIIPLDINLR